MAKTSSTPAADIVDAIQQLRSEVVNILRSFNPQTLFGGGGGGLFSAIRSIGSITGFISGLVGKTQGPDVPTVGVKAATGLAGMAAHNLPSVLPVAESAAALATNPAGWIVALGAAATLATVALAAAPTAIHHFVDSLIESNRGLAEFSGAMAITLAQSDFRNIMRDIRRGDALASSVRDLTTANARLKDSTLGLEVGFEKLTNKLAEAIARIANMVVESRPGRFGLGALEGAMAGLTQAVESGLATAEGMAATLKLIKDNTEKTGDPEPMADFFNRVAADGLAAQGRNDPRFGRAQGFR